MSRNDADSGACPGDGRLAAWHARELEPPEHDAVTRHLQACAACAGQAERMRQAHDTWVARCRAARECLRGAIAQTPTLPALEIQGYMLVREIRRGGQGIVFLAVQCTTKREVALKVLREGRLASTLVRRRFEREVELAAGLRHPHIVTVFDSGTTSEGDLYFVMDYIKGVALDAFVRARALAIVPTLALVSRICRAVHHAHQRGVIHRDLKPSNILVDEDGEPHVLDFGLARPVDREDAALATATGQVAGTLPYISPEQARGLADAVDVRSDVYALGVILYELVTGRLPYPVDADVLQTLRRIAETPPDRPNRMLWRGGGAGEAPAGRGVDADVETIILKALAKDREHRYQSAAELGRDIDHYLAGAPIAARRDSAWYVLRTVLRRHRRTASAVTAGILLLCTALGVSLASWRNAVAQRDAAKAAQILSTERSEQLRALARFFVVEFDPMIARLPGSARARQAIVEKGQEYLELLTEQAEGDPSMRLELARAYLALGDVQGDLTTSNLGELGPALASYERAWSCLPDAREPASRTADAFALRALCLLKEADARMTLGEHEAAVTAYERALDEARAGLNLFPDALPLWDHLGAAHERLGYACMGCDDLDGAQEHFDKASSIGEKIEHAVVTDALRLRAVSLNHSRLAAVHYARGERVPALERYRRFAEGIERALVLEPRHPVLRRDLATGYQWMGILQGEQGAHAEALQAYAQSIALSESVLSDDASDDAARTELAATLSKAGESRAAVGEREQARIDFERSIAEARSVLAHQPELSRAQRLLGVGYYKLFELERDAFLDEALSPDARRVHAGAAGVWLERCLALFEELQNRHRLGTADAQVPDELRQELAEFRALVAESER